MRFVPPVALAAALLAAGAVQAETVRFTAALKGSQEVPANSRTQNRDEKRRGVMGKKGR